MTGLETLTLLTAIIGAVCGVCGAVLGVINTWSQLSRNRVRLKVVPKMAFMVNGGVITSVRLTDMHKGLVRSHTPSRWCIEVVNLSTFPVTISEAGFGKDGDARCIIPHPEVSPHNKWPVRLESREAVTVYAAIGEALDPAVVQHHFAHVETDCGVVCYGTSPIFEGYYRALAFRRGEEE